MQNVSWVPFKCPIFKCGCFPSSRALLVQLVREEHWKCFSLVVSFSSWKTDIMVNFYFYKSFQIFRNFIPLGNKGANLKLFKCWCNGVVCQWSALVTLACQMFPVSGSLDGSVRLSRQAGGWLCSSTPIKSPVGVLSLAAKWWHSRGRELTRDYLGDWWDWRRVRQNECFTTWFVGQR